MNIEEAKKMLQAVKPKDNYLLVSLAYSNKFVFPYKEGMAVIEAFSKAEMLDEPYNAQHRIKPIERIELEFRVLSADEYERIKIAAILGVSPKEILEAQNTPTTE